MIAVVILALALAQATAVQTSDDEALRGLVQQYFDAQAREDAGAALTFWSPGAVNAPTREALSAVFAAGDDVFRANVLRIDRDGDTARLRVLVDRTRTAPGRGGMLTTQRTSTFLLERWTRDGSSWKLMEDKPLADDVADTLLAAPSERWASMLAAEDPAFVRGPLRYTVGSRGSIAAARQQYANALAPFTLLREIGRAAGDVRVQLEALQNLGNANFFLRRYDAAADAYRDQLTAARSAHDEDFEAAALDGGAMVAYSRGDYTAALDGYSASLEIAERKNDQSAIGRALVSVGNVQYLQAEYDLAAASYKRAISLLADGGNGQTVSMAWRGAARVYVAQGDLASALVAANHALEDARARAARSEIANDQENIGEIHFKLGNAAEARMAFDSARETFDALHDVDSAGRLLGDIGLTELVAERFDAAVAAYTESRKRFQEARNPAGIGHAWVGIGFSEAGRGRFEDAIDAYTIAIGIFNAGNRKEDAGRAWLGLSLAHYGAGNYPSALEDAAHVSTIAADLHNDDLAWRAHVRAGDALRRLTRLDEAQTEYDGAIAIIQQILPRAATSADVRTELEDSASAWAGLAFTLADQGDAEAAWLAAEQRRSHVLRVMLAPFERDITRGMTPDEITAERALARTIVSYTAQLRAERAAPKPDPQRIARIERQLGAATADRTGQQVALYRRHPDLRLWRGLRPLASIDQLPPALGPDSIAVEYLTSDDQLLILTAAREPRPTDDGLWTTATTASVVPWKRHEFAVALSQALEPAALADAPEWRRRAKSMADTLLSPLGSQMAGKTQLVIVPDDLLWKVPFEALPFGASDVYSTARVTYSSSLFTIALRRAPREGEDVSFIAAPALAADTETQLAAAVPHWTPLDADAVRRDIDEQATAYGAHAHVVAGTEATQAAAIAALDRAAVVEIAARVQLSGAAPLFSCALLAPAAADRVDDGRWEVREWFNADAHGAAIVLPDGGGLATAGLDAAIAAVDWASAAAGTSAVVMAWTPAEAFSVTRLLHDFHAARAQGASLGDAYTSAVSAARAGGEAAPAEWAGLRRLGRIR